MTIGERIKALRERHGLTQLQLGNIAGVSDKAVSTWEKDANVPRMGPLQRMADYFNVSKSYILGDDETQAADDDLWTLRDEEREDPDRKALYLLAKYGSAKDIRQAKALIDALKATNPDFYDGDDPA